MQNKIIKRLNEIYSKIPNFQCRHCHKCSGPIIWFKPEEINIRNYLKENNIEYVVWSIDDFKKNNMMCPYLKNDRCSIYPVRPIVCRLQGNISELPCEHNKNNYMNKKLYLEIKKEFNTFLKEIGGTDVFYGTRKLILKS